MNEMPVPAGSWAEHYNANQKKYNMHLFLGVTIFAASIYAVSSSTWLQFLWLSSSVRAIFFEHILIETAQLPN